MTEQEIFNTVAKHLLKQGKAATHEGKPYDCAYRGQGGTKCAVGCLISDDVYDKKMEGLYVTGLIEEFPVLEHLAPHVRLLGKLQHAHDDFLAGSDHLISSMTAWRSKMRDIAELFELDASVLD